MDDIYVVTDEGDVRIRDDVADDEIDDVGDNTIAVLRLQNGKIEVYVGTDHDSGVIWKPPRRS